MIKRALSKLRKVTMSLFAVLCVGAVWAEEGEVTTPEVIPEPEPAPSTSALTIDPSAGYILTGLGELRDQVAVVFTNSAAVATWKAPKDLKNVEFLAVGGGGGGGVHYYSSTAKNRQGGAGGGGGAVVTGYIKELSEEAIVSIQVGKGGTNCVYSSGSTKKATNGGNSTIKVGELNYITAYGGGGDGGKDSAGVGIGGSNSGARKNLAAADLVSVNAIGDGAENLVSDVVSRAHKGGSGYYAGSSGYPAAGGGGAGGEGGSTGDSSSSAANGGAGYESFITDVGVIYGAGGAGGYGKSGTAGSGTKRLGGGREDSGAGHSDFNKNGTDAAANRGGGGGGGSYQKAGGDGGSGVVILRFGYSEADIIVDATVNIEPKITNKKYTGETLTSGLVNTYAYTVQELGDCLTASGGPQKVLVTLNEGYVWSDGSTDPKEFEWNVLKEDNNQWTVAPSLVLNSWPQSYAENVVFVPAVPMRGVLVATIEDMNGCSSFNGTLPTEPGTYTIKYEVVETNDYSPLCWEKTFTIYRSEDFEGGYKVFGLGENGNEVAMVFTGVTEEPITWTVPYNYTNAQFLVVGGGGGGGAENGGDDQRQAGAGGGGGGVVTGVVTRLESNSVVTIKVGAGGAGGVSETKFDSSSSSYGASGSGDASYFEVDGVEYVYAFGGGGDGGAAKNAKAGAQGKTGGSSGGSRPGCTTLGSITPARTNNVALASAESFGNKGGKGYGSASYYGLYAAAGGGGGATEPGYDATGTSKAGNGGQGLLSDIMGAPLVYGSGGGGATVDGANGGLGGNGAGDGNTAARNTNSGANASPYQGGGGGGASREGNGGAGGSGIVVLRYEQLVDVDELNLRLADRVYNGNVQTIEDSVAYTVTGENKSATVYGTYSVIITPKDGYLWPDTKTNEGREYTWSITQATNEWTQDCAVSILTWTIKLDAPGTVTPALAKYGDVTAKIKKEGEENEVDFVSFPEEAGTYTVTYYPETTASFNSAGMSTQSFTVVILSPEEIPDYTVTTGEVTASLDRKITIPYNVACSASTGYKTTLYVEYVTEGVETKTNTYDAVALSKPGSTGDLVIEDLKPGATYTVKVFAQVNDQGQVGEIVELEPVQIAIPGAATGLAANATFTDESFTISGKINPAYTPGADDCTIVTVYWSLNGNTLDNSQVFRFKDTDDGVFSVTQAYNAVTDKLYWKVEVSNTITTDTWSGQTFDSSNSEGLNIAQQVKERRDSTSITYTWTGNGGDNLWANRANWSWAATDSSATGVEAYGYPGKISSEGSYQSKIVFANDAVVDLNGATMYVNGAFEMASDIEVEVRNGTLGFQTSILSLGAENSTLTFKNVLLPYNSSNPSARYTIKPADNSTLIIDGDNSLAYAAYGHLKYSPTTSGRFMLKNYAGRMFTTNEAFNNDSEVVISNAQWSVWVGETSTSTAPKGLAKKLVFYEGDQQSGKIRFLANYWGDEGFIPVNLDGTECDIKLTANSHLNNNEKINARCLTQDAAVTFNIDVTDYTDATPIKLVYFTKIASGNYTLTPTLKATANEEDVTDARNASIYSVDEGDGRVYYYKQDSQNVAAVATVRVDAQGDEFISYEEYPTLEAAINAAEPGGTVVLRKDIELTTFVTITKSLTLDLNGKSINRADGTALYVNGDATTTVTIQGDEGSVSGDQAVYVNAGTVIINGGTFRGISHAVYVINNGHAEIKGGTFSSEDGQYHYVLNEYDQTRDATSIVVNGGKFKGFNPANNEAEGANTDFCAEGLCGYVVETVDGVDFYGVAAAVAAIGEVKFASLDAAIAAAGAGDTVKLLADVVAEKVVVVPTGATLDLNGKSIQALAVVGKLAMNGGALKTYDTNTQTYFFMAAPAETAALYWTSDAVMTIGDDYALSLDGGSVTLPNSWRSLLKQTLTIKSGATFVIPQGVELNLRGNAVVEEGATLMCDGTIALGNTYDAIDTSATLTSAQLAEGKVISAVEGFKAQYADGEYTLVPDWTAPMPTPEGTAETTAKYDQAVSDALANVEAQSITVTVNGEQKLGNAAVEALNTAFASFENKDGSALAFADAAATLDIEIKVTEINAAEPEKSTVVVKRGTEELTVKVTPTVKYFYPETKTWGYDKPESGAVLFKFVFEAPSAN